MEVKFKTYKTYKKESEYSYALGASVTIELLRQRPEDCLSVIFSPDYVDREGIIESLCAAHN
ncbi:MAG: hypothetical protein FWH48_01150, partial [Oscillospiraceae bacterium]|nr:hypothetical protein [Oscillospiraceae bacterium]